MKKTICGLAALGALLCAGVLTAPEAEATGSRFKDGRSMAPKVTLLSRSFRWLWDPFRVEGNNAYAVAFITNKHQFALTLKTYCKANGKLMRALSGRHLIAPGETLKWDTRQLLREAGEDVRAIVNCRFWVDGTIDLRGQIVNRAPARMGQEGNPFTLITFNYAEFSPHNG
ncbi:MAG: hypothetical protein ACLFWF_12450 [Alphaproteobacteria bacterium]